MKTDNRQAIIHLAHDALAFADQISTDWPVEKQLTHLREQIALARKHLESEPDDAIKQVQANAVMHFMATPVGAYESGFVDTPHCTIAQMYQVARHHVKDTYGIETKSLAEEMGEAFARECMGRPAVNDVIDERLRQVSAEGWTPEHDDQHGMGDMAEAAACYAVSTSLSDRPWETYWPWADEWWKPTTPRRNLVKAGALILAEIERLDRVEQKEGEQHEA